jgi:hypothetical protein
LNWRIHHRAETASTNIDAREGSHGDVFTADFQTSGRGRLDHRWLSPPGVNLLMSAVLDVGGISPEEAATFPLVAGLSVVKALPERIRGDKVMLKWPNDLLQGEKGGFLAPIPKKNACRKVGGILLEERFGALVAGIGINTESAPEDSSLRDNYAFSAGIIRSACGAPFFRAQAGNTKESQGFVSIFTLWKRLVERLFSCYAYTTEPAPWWPALAEKHLAFRRCRAVLADACPENEAMERVFCEGIVDGVTPTGALRLRTEYGMDTFLGGSLLPGS